MAENLNILLWLEIEEFEFDKYWFRTFWLIEVYFICIITSGSLYI